MSDVIVELELIVIWNTRFLIFHNDINYAFDDFKLGYSFSACIPAASIRISLANSKGSYLLTAISLPLGKA